MQHGRSVSPTVDLNDNSDKFFRSHGHVGTSREQNEGGDEEELGEEGGKTYK